MAKGIFAGDLRAFADLSRQNIRYILNEAVQDVMEGAQTPQQAISAGAASFERGKIPENSGELINSLHLDGQAVGRDAAVGGMIEPGTVQTFEWQAPYAARIEYGFVGEDALGRRYEQAGRFFVTDNAEKFAERVEYHARAVSK